MAAAASRSGPISRPPSVVEPLSDSINSGVTKLQKLKKLITPKTKNTDSSEQSSPLTPLGSQDGIDKIQSAQSTQEARKEYENCILPSLTPTPEPASPTNYGIEPGKKGEELSNVSVEGIIAPEDIKKNEVTMPNKSRAPSPISSGSVTPTSASKERQAIQTHTLTSAQIPKLNDTDSIRSFSPAEHEQTPEDMRFEADFSKLNDHPFNTSDSHAVPTNEWLRTMHAHLDLDFKVIARSIENRYLGDQTLADVTDSRRFAVLFRDQTAEYSGYLNRMIAEMDEYIQDTTREQLSSQPGEDQDMEIVFNDTDNANPETVVTHDIPITAESLKTPVHAPVPAAPAPQIPESADPAVNFLVQLMMKQDERITALEKKETPTSWSDLQKTEHQPEPPIIDMDEFINQGIPLPATKSVANKPAPPKPASIEPISWSSVVRGKPAKSSAAPVTNEPSPAKKAPNPSKPGTFVKNVSAANIAQALHNGNKIADDSTDFIKYIVKFSVTPMVQPEPQILIPKLRAKLAESKFGLGNGALVHSKWSGKGNLTLSFSKTTSHNIIKQAIPVMLGAFQWPDATFEPCEPLTRLAITNFPTGLQSLTSVYGRNEIKSVLRPHIPNFDKLKMFLEPDWIANPLRLNAEGRPTSTIAFTFVDPGKIISKALLERPRLYIDGLVCHIKPFTTKPLLEMCSNCARYGHTHDKCQKQGPLHQVR
ncbi:hypothetical protein OPQ81_005382 [Rhizoctonia solani]|nr:hypothetical protein OPQ81_005382 [Rhizoctonia solani]